MNELKQDKKVWVYDIDADEACFECLDSLLKQFSHRVDIVTS